MLRVAVKVRTPMALSRAARVPMRPGAAAARRTIATTRLAVLRTGDALLGYGGLTQALWRNKEDGSQLVLVAVEADDSPDTLFDGLSDDLSLIHI